MSKCGNKNIDFKTCLLCREMKNFGSSARMTWNLVRQAAIESPLIGVSTPVEGNNKVYPATLEEVGEAFAWYKR